MTSAADNGASTDPLPQGFYNEHGGGLDHVSLQTVQGDPHKFRLQTPFTYWPSKSNTGPDAERIQVPRSDQNSTTDLATVPPWLWGLVASYGTQTLPALLHDHLCDQAARESNPDLAYPLRQRADRLFHEALMFNGLPPVRAGVLFAGVTIDTLMRYRRLVGLTFVAQAFAFAAAVLTVIAAGIWALIGGGVSSWICWPAAVAVTAAVLAALWIPAGLGKPVLCGIGAGPIALVVIAVTGLASYLLAVPDYLIAAAQWLDNKLRGAGHEIHSPGWLPVPYRLRLR